MGSPLISISVTTYQHASWLARCLDGILLQQCPFEYEVLLGEDGSMDGTREIAKRYAEAHPDLIRLFLHDRSKVVRIDGRVTGRYNFLNNIRQARGRYLCHLDGDDYWTDPDRLRIMVEKMEAEPELGLAFHNAWNQWPDGRKEAYVEPVDTKPRYSRSDLTIKNFIPTSGVIWRFDGIKEIPRSWAEGPFGDWVLNIHFAGKGPVGYVDRFMSVRNVNEGSAMAAMDPIRTLRTIALAYEVMHTQVGSDMAVEGVDRWRRSLTDGFDMAMNAGRMEDARWFLRHALANVLKPISARERLRWWALIHFPRLMRWYQGLRSGTPKA